MESKIFSLLILFMLCYDKTIAWKHFWKGRKHSGNLGEPSETAVNELYWFKQHWLDQPLDHTNLSNIQLWKQRYFVNREFYKSGSPIFLMIGGEGEASSKWMDEGEWIHYAKKFNALCFMLEHRFYGKSHPTKTLSIENLKYLTSEQALADIENFIYKMNIKNNIKDDQKWIAFGGSYPGSLAAWLKEKYPNLIHGAISSSGPLLAKVDFVEYYDVVENSIASYSLKCVESVKKAINDLKLLLNEINGKQELNDLLRLCTPIENSHNPLDKINLFESVASNFAGVVQYNKDNSPHATITIDDVCHIMENENLGSLLERLSKVNKLVLKSNNETCLDYEYDKMIREMKDESWTAKVADGTRQWTFQTCNEFGFYQTSESEKSLFGNTFDAKFFIQQCMDIFSTKYNSTTLEEEVEQTNKYYGALNPNTTNVLYVHGSIDPWHTLGLTTSTDDRFSIIYINGTAHCANMYEPRDFDLPQLVAAREKILEFLMNILK